MTYMYQLEPVLMACIATGSGEYMKDPLSLVFASVRPSVSTEAGNINNVLSWQREQDHMVVLVPLLGKVI